MIRDTARLFEDICRVITESDTPSGTLEKIVEQMAVRFGIDVCSVYLLIEKENRLELSATIGLNRSTMHTVTMGANEGLTGWVVEKKAPVFVRNPSDHPRNKYFAESGEEKYSTFLGVPMVYHQRMLGVLVIQTISENAVTEEDISVFSAIATQMAATVAYSGLMDALESKRSADSRMAPAEPERVNSAPALLTAKKAKTLLKGIAAAPGFGEGVVHLMPESIDFNQVTVHTADDSQSEIRRLRKAVEAAVAEVGELMDHVGQIQTSDRAVLEAHSMMLRDKTFLDKISNRIEKGASAEFALKETVHEVAAVFRGMEDSYLRERAADIEDAGRRLLRNLLGIRWKMDKAFAVDTVVVASDLSPVDLMAMNQESLKGVVLTGGGKTSHAVILAKSFEIPMVIGLEDAMEVLREGEFTILDGTSGLVFRKPPLAIVEAYAHLKEEKERSFVRLDAIRESPAETIDEFKIGMGANIGLLSDLALVEKYGADHIGLYRTEFPFLARKDFPTEEEQESLYRKIILGAGGRMVTIRTLDIGGDKFLAYMDAPGERNPYLGWRSIRISLEREDIFRTQIRAVLKAAEAGPVQLMFPMISSVAEIKAVTAIIEEEKRRLDSSGRVPEKEIPLGIMIEVPGAVKILPHLLKWVDFVSIGTNDLIQYTLAVDRDNTKVAHLFDPFHPAVLATVNEIIEICRSHDKTVGICGEAAAHPACAWLFLAMQPDRLSMTPANIPLVKYMIRSSSMTEAKETLASVLEMDDPGEILKAVESRMPEISP